MLVRALLCIVLACCSTALAKSPPSQASSASLCTPEELAEALSATADDVSSVVTVSQGPDGKMRVAKQQIFPVKVSKRRRVKKRPLEELDEDQQGGMRKAIWDGCSLAIKWGTCVVILYCVAKWTGFTPFGLGKSVGQGFVDGVGGIGNGLWHGVRGQLCNLVGVLCEGEPVQPPSSPTATMPPVPGGQDDATPTQTAFPSSCRRELKKIRPGGCGSWLGGDACFETICS